MNDNFETSNRKLEHVDDVFLIAEHGSLFYQLVDC